MTSPVITAAGIVCGLGVGRREVAEGWRAGAGGTAIGSLPLRDLFPEQRATLRRMDRLSRLICLAAGLARDDGPGLGDAARLALGVGTDLGTLDETWAFLGRLRDKGPALANPLAFPNLVPNAGAGYAGIFCGLRGPSHTFCQHGTCGDEAIGWAADGVRMGWFDGALAGGAEELCDVRAKAQARGGCLPDAPLQGESAALVLVESRARAAARGAVPLAEILGSWAACRSPRRSPLAWEAPGDALLGLAELALAEAGSSWDRVGVVLGSHPGLLPGKAPETDHHGRIGVHPADGAFRIALAACLLSDPSLPVRVGGRGVEGDVAMVASAARGGSLRVTLLGKVADGQPPAGAASPGCAP